MLFSFHCKKIEIYVEDGRIRWKQEDKRVTTKQEQTGTARYRKMGTNTHKGRISQTPICACLCV